MKKRFSFLLRLGLLGLAVAGLYMAFLHSGLTAFIVAWAVEFFTPPWVKVLAGNLVYAGGNLGMIVLTYWVLDKVLLGRLKIADEIKGGNMTVTIFVSLIIAAVILSGKTAVGAEHPAVKAAKPYFETVETAHNRFFGRGSTVPYQLIVSQFYQESHFKPSAESHVGAMGVAQIMPGTRRDIERQLGPFNPWNARDSIYAGTWYVANRWNVFRYGNKTTANRMAFALASYNAGLGYILKAQKLAGKDSQRWLPVAEALYKVPRVYAEEPVTYVRLIFYRYNEVFKAKRDPVLNVS